MPKEGPRLPARLATLALIAAPTTTLLAPAVCEAGPQGTVGLTIGAAGAGLNREIWEQTVFHLGIHGDVLFGRSKNTDFGVGPYLELFTHAFDEVQFGGGASFLLPVIDYLPVVVSLGAYGRKGDDLFGVEPGITGQLFWGSRSYNFHANYVMQAGIIGQMRYGLGESRETSIVVGAHLDFAAMSLPFLFLINAIRGGSPDTDPVEPEVAE
jgi:hypothetical protein